MKKRIAIITTIFFALTFTSCKVDDKKTIDISLLKSDWLNAKYNYFLFFSNSTVFTPPDENSNFVFNYKTKTDTLFLGRKLSTGIHYWAEYKVLLLNRDVLILKNISKRDSRLKSDTITFVNISTINKNEAQIKSLKFSFIGKQSMCRNFEIIDDSIKYSDKGNPENLNNYKAKLSPSIINELNLKIKLFEPYCLFDYKIEGYPRIDLTLELKENFGNGNTIKMKGSAPDPERNIKLAAYITFLINLNETIELNDYKK